ncbi:MAG: segregation/condensation protein A [Anaerolineales bacterium]|nr:segregation/condensation protein A [Anaerolineales bacterium]
MSTDQAYLIQLPVYEGPLDLLLELIEQAELDITKIALAQITDQYLNHLRRLQERHLEDLTSFLVIAARLLQIKSEALLPRPPAREPGEEDPGDALARQLIAYQKYKEVAEFLAERLKADLRSYVRISAPPIIDPKLDMIGVELTDLREALLDVLASVRDESGINDVVMPQPVKIRDRIIRILESLARSSRTTFRKVIRGAKSRLEIVVSFIAVLELVKQQRISADQEALFGEITISRGDDWREDQEMDFDLEFEE